MYRTVAVGLLIFVLYGCSGGSSGLPDSNSAAGEAIALTAGADNPRVAINFARALAVTDSGVHAVWVQGLDSGSVWYRRSLDHGASWEPPVRLGDAKLPQEGMATIAAAGDAIFVAWHDLRPPNPRILLRRSLDGGQSWAPAKVLVDGPAAVFPSLAALGDAVQLVFANTPAGEQVQELYASRSENRGEDWSKPELLSTIPYASFVPHAGLGEQGGYAAWVDYQDANEEVYFRRWTPSGGWQPSQRITENAADSWAAQMAAYGDQVHITWFDRRGTSIQGEGVEKMLNDALTLIGQNPDPIPVRTANVYYLPSLIERLEQKRQAIAAAAPRWITAGGDPGRLNVILKDAEEAERDWNGGWEIYYRRSDDGGRTFGPEQRLTNAAGASQRPSIAVDGKSVYIAWFDARGMDPEIYLRSSADGGSTWGDELRITNAPGASTYPTVAVDNEYVHVLWTDSRTGSTEVYYVRMNRPK